METDRRSKTSCFVQDLRNRDQKWVIDLCGIRVSPIVIAWASIHVQSILRTPEGITSAERTVGPSCTR